MKLKKAIAFLLALTMMMSLTACSEKDDSSSDKKNETTISSNTDSEAKDTEDDSDSEDSAPELLKEPLDKANANCEVIFSAAQNFSEKCQTAGIIPTKTDGDCTGVLVINAAAEGAKPLNVNGASSANPTLSESAITEISKAVNNGLSYSEVNVIGTVYCIFYNDKGKPTEVFWAENETSTIVGKYPSEDTYAYTEGGINSIVQNGPEAFGNISLG